jgi:hypothetical protein
VYATFGGPVPRPAACWAAVLGGGDDPMLSHRTAAQGVGVADPEPGALVHVTVPSERRIVPAGGLIVHVSARAAAARHPRRRPPQTRVEETVLDLATDAATPDDAVAWVAAACGRSLTAPDRIARALRARDRFRWRHVVEAALRDADIGVASVLEHRYRVTVERAHGLPRGSHRGPPDTVGYPDFGVRVALRLPAVWDRPCALAVRVATALRQGGWHGLPARCGRPDCGVVDG